MFKVLLESPSRVGVLHEVTAPVDTVYEARLFGLRRLSEIIGTRLRMGSILYDHVWSLFVDGRHVFNMKVVSN